MEARVRSVSRKQAKKNREYAKTRKLVIERDGGYDTIDGNYAACRVRRVLSGHRCAGALEVHHLRRRSQGGGDTLDNLISVCHAGHHSYIHAYPAEAAEFGLLVLRPDAGEDR